MSDRILLLVHGVGNGEEGEIRSAARRLLAPDEFSEGHIEEFYWNAIVDAPGHRDWWSLVTPGYFSDLLRGICSSALEGCGPERRFGLPAAVFILLSFAPPLVWWGASVELLRLIRALPVAWQPLLPTLMTPLVPALIVGRTAVAHSAGALKVAVSAWLACLAVTAIVFLLSHAVRRRGSVLGALRTLGLAVVWLFTVGAAIVARTLVWVLAFLPLMVWGILYNFSIVPSGESETTVIPSFFDLFANAPRAISSVVLVGAGAVVGVWFIHTAVAPTLKVIADIFRYIGDREYRDALHTALEQRLAGLQLAEKELYLVGHSLGSVIAIDALLRCRQRLCGCSSITLVTLGSPLRRFFWRFFRTAIPQPDAMAARLDLDYARFRWINVYRPFDPIGSGVFRAAGRDFSTRQYWRLFAWAHTNYWSDSNVLQRVRAALAAPPVRAIETPAAESQPFEALGRQRFSRAALRTSIGLWIVVPLSLLCASWFYFDTYFTLAEYNAKVRRIEARPGQSEVEIWERPIHTITNTGFFTTYTEDMLSYRAGNTRYSDPIKGVSVHALKNAEHGPVRVRYRVDRPAEYYIPGYDEPTWPAGWRWVGLVTLCGLVSLGWTVLMVGAGSLVATKAFGLSTPVPRSLPVDVPAPTREELTAQKIRHRRLFRAVVALIVAASGAYALWTRVVRPHPSFQLSSIRRTVEACLESHCSDPGWIPLLAILGQPDRAVTASRDVPLLSRVWVLVELDKVGVQIADAEYEAILDAAAVPDRYDVSRGIIALGTIARHLDGAGQPALAKRARQTAAEHLKAFDGVPFAGFQTAADARLPDELASRWNEALAIVTTEQQESNESGRFALVLGPEVIFPQPRPSSGHASAALRAQYIFDKIPQTADLERPLALIKSWPPTYEQLGATMALASGLIRVDRDKEAHALVDRLPRYWTGRTALPLQVPPGDAARLPVDLQNVFRHFANRGDGVALRRIVAKLPAASDAQKAAQAGLDRAKVDAAATDPDETAMKRARVLIAAHAYEEAHDLAEAMRDGDTRWQILTLIVRALLPS